MQRLRKAVKLFLLAPAMLLYGCGHGTIAVTTPYKQATKNPFVIITDLKSIYNDNSLREYNESTPGGLGSIDDVIAAHIKSVDEACLDRMIALCALALQYHTANSKNSLSLEGAFWRSLADVLLQQCLVSTDDIRAAWMIALCDLEVVGNAPLELQLVYPNDPDRLIILVDAMRLAPSIARLNNIKNIISRALRGWDIDVGNMSVDDVDVAVKSVIVNAKVNERYLSEYVDARDNEHQYAGRLLLHK